MKTWMQSEALESIWTNWKNDNEAICMFNTLNRKVPFSGPQQDMEASYLPPLRENMYLVQQRRTNK